MNRSNTEAQAKLDPAWPYAASGGFYDEVLGGNGEIRPVDFLAEALRPKLPGAFHGHAFAAALVAELAADQNLLVADGAGFVRGEGGEI